MSTGIEAMVVARPLTIDAKKWQKMPSLTYEVFRMASFACEYVAN